MRVCWNRQTGTFEGRVSFDVRVQVPSLAPQKDDVVTYKKPCSFGLFYYFAKKRSPKKNYAFLRLIFRSLIKKYFLKYITLYKLIVITILLCFSLFLVLFYHVFPLLLLLIFVHLLAAFLSTPIVFFCLSCQHNVLYL